MTHTLRSRLVLVLGGDAAAVRADLLAADPAALDGVLVAINSDDSVRKLKGPNRPVCGQDERAEMLGALECVDFVTVFDEPDPYKVISALQPDVLVKGGDWPLEKIVGYREVTTWGGSVHSIPFVHQRSTTALMEKIRRL